jgi:hypothetical protein
MKARQRAGNVQNTTRAATASVAVLAMNKTTGCRQGRPWSTYVRMHVAFAGDMLQRQGLSGMLCSERLSKV